MKIAFYIILFICAVYLKITLHVYFRLGIKVITEGSGNWRIYFGKASAIIFAIFFSGALWTDQEGSLSFLTLFSTMFSVCIGVCIVGYWVKTINKPRVGIGLGTGINALRQGGKEWLIVAKYGFLVGSIFFLLSFILLADEYSKRYSFRQIILEYYDFLIGISIIGVFYGCYRGIYVVGCRAINARAENK